jgi:hypothetical protein
VSLRDNKMIHELSGVMAWECASNAGDEGLIPIEVRFGRMQGRPPNLDLNGRGFD